MSIPDDLPCPRVPTLPVYAASLHVPLIFPPTSIIGGFQLCTASQVGLAHSTACIVDVLIRMLRCFERCRWSDHQDGMLARRLPGFAMLQPPTGSVSFADEPSSAASICRFYLLIIIMQVSHGRHCLYMISCITMTHQSFNRAS